jgi:uncharacterized protein YcbX
VTTIDPNSAEMRGDEPLRTLRLFRRRYDGLVVFGQIFRAVGEGGGVVTVGAEVKVVATKMSVGQLLVP